MSRLPVFVLLCVPYTFLVRRFWFANDDAFISFRFARNLALGNGIRYNPGDHTPVEGYSNFLWVLVCSVFEKLGLDIAVWALLASAACGYLLLWLVLDHMVRRLGIAPLPAGLAALTLAAFPPFALWSTSGLATMPFALLVFLTFDRLVLRGRPDSLGGGLAALGLALIRVEGIAWCAVLFGIAAVVHRRHLRPLLAAAAIPLVGYAAYSGWRLAHHGHLLSNTAQAKLSTALLLAGWMRGVRYVMTHFVVFLTPFLLIPATVMALRHGRRARGLPVALMAWAFPAYAVAVTGDFMPMSRYLIPALAFQTVLYGWMLQDLARRSRSLAAAATAGMVVLGALPGWDIHLVPEDARRLFLFRHGAPRFTSEYHRWLVAGNNAHRWRVKGEALRAYVEAHPFESPEPVCVTGPLGCVGYYAGLPMLDRIGLVTPSVISEAIRQDPGECTPGHDQGVNYAFFADLRPEILQAKVVRTTNPEVVLRRCKEFSARLDLPREYGGLSGEYVVDFAHLPAVAADYPVVLMTWRKIEGDPDAEWAAYRARADSLKAEIEVQERREGEAWEGTR